MKLKKKIINKLSFTNESSIESIKDQYAELAINI